MNTQEHAPTHPQQELLDKKDQALPIGACCELPHCATCVEFSGNIFDLSTETPIRQLQLKMLLNMGGFESKVKDWNDPEKNIILLNDDNTEKTTAEFIFYKNDRTFKGLLSKDGSIKLTVDLGDTRPKEIQPLIASTALKEGNKPLQTHKEPVNINKEVTQPPVTYESQSLPTREVINSTVYHQTNEPITGTTAYDGTLTQPTQKYSQGPSTYNSVGLSDSLIVETKPIRKQSSPPVEPEIPIQPTNLPFKRMGVMPNFQEYTYWMNQNNPKDDWDLFIPEPTPKKAKTIEPLQPQNIRYNLDKEVIKVEKVAATVPLQPQPTELLDQTVSPLEVMIKTHKEAREILIKFLQEISQPLTSKILPSQENPKDSVVRSMSFQPLQLIKQFIIGSGAKERIVEINMISKEEKTTFSYPLVENQTQQDQTIMDEPNQETPVITIVTDSKEKRTIISTSKEIMVNVQKKLQTYVTTYHIDTDKEVTPQENHDDIANIYAPVQDTFVGVLMIIYSLFVEELILRAAYIQHRYLNAY